MSESNVVWSPQPRQIAFMSRPEDEALYGGAAGGGKSDALVMEATRQIHIPHYKGLIIRKTYPQLAELIDKSQSYYKKAFPDAVYNASEHTWRFPSGAKIIFGSMQHSNSKFNYQGKAYDFIGFDELTHFTYDEYIYLISRNRPNGAGTRCYMRASANPGGIGHGWVKDRFITAGRPMETIWEKRVVRRPDGSLYENWMSRIFVPSSVFDNKALLDNDPNYLARLASLPDAERKALLYGDWDSFSGQYFAEWRDNPDHYQDRRWTHVIEPFEIPDGWKIYRSFDFGYHRPFSVGWWAVDYDGVVYRILELYGCTDTPNQGVRWTPDQIFTEVHRIESEHRWLKGKNIIGIADPAIWKAETGESVADTAAKHQVYFTKGDNQRLAGWMQVHYRLSFDENNGFPMMYIFNNCKATIRTLPTLIFDTNKVEDLDSEGEDHIADEIRYFCMSRPIKPRVSPKPDEYASSPMAMFLDIPKEDIRAAARLPRMEVITDGDV